MSVAIEAPPVGALLRTWRERRRFSQQELSNRSRVSTRHLSRVETGKAHPTPEMLMLLSDNLDVPLRDRNRLLLAAGYAPRYQDHQWGDASIEVVMDGLRRLLDAHLPYPALLLDDHWDIVDANAAVDQLLTGCAQSLLEPPINVARVCLHPDGLARRIGNLAEWGNHLLREVSHRAERTHDQRHYELAAELAGHLGKAAAATPRGPVITLEIDVDGDPLRFFSVSATLSTATDAALEGLHLETFLPADDKTRSRYEPRSREDRRVVAEGVPHAGAPGREG
ncbi:helix-turn-helix domain-containing protein [Streptomyces montanisoli]|uniref:Helix-turn-helix transcriptional regulator n=1 Tax=Streptomyces montanisoli TaxID=2798581 RepID=A0A940RYZ1_9ACTN|nr:helix-turn-helix transcriptional regulator [Streptomyces montanisoli]MBP0459204.1 helix-turn-helix transcriptional regulator [Streptomyces montanisoli]